MPEHCPICDTELEKDWYCTTCHRRVRDEILEQQEKIHLDAIDGWRRTNKELEAQIKQTKRDADAYFYDLLAWITGNSYGPPSAYIPTIRFQWQATLLKEVKSVVRKLERTAAQHEESNNGN